MDEGSESIYPRCWRWVPGRNWIETSGSKQTANIKEPSSGGLFVAPNHTILRLLDPSVHHSDGECNVFVKKVWHDFSARLDLGYPDRVTLDQISKAAQDIFRQMENFGLPPIEREAEIRKEMKSRTVTKAVKFFVLEFESDL